MMSRPIAHLYKASPPYSEVEFDKKEFEPYFYLQHDRFVNEVMFLLVERLAEAVGQDRAEQGIIYSYEKNKYTICYRLVAPAKLEGQ